MQTAAPSNAAPRFSEALRFWLKLGFISFGGPAGQIAVMHEELVERKKWIGEERFLHALNYCMLLPGPEAQQLAIYTGWLLHRAVGGVAAGVLFVLPSALILWALSWLYMAGQDLEWVRAVFYGLKPAVLAIVAAAVLRIGGRALRTPALWGVAAAAFGALAFLKTPFPLIVALAALAGWFGAGVRRSETAAAAGNPTGSREPETPSPADLATRAEQTVPGWSRALKVTAICLVLWFLPLLAVLSAPGLREVHGQQGVFFSKAAVVTFGGAYAVLPYVAREAVERHHWLSATQMMDGLGLAETTPGPLIMVLQFVGFAGGWHHPPPGWSPLASATLGAAITTWVTFVPCFLWILLGAPFIERLRGAAAPARALSAVTAAVTGVMLHLAVWFAAHAVFPGGASDPRPDWFVAATAAVVFFGMWRWKWGVIPAVVSCALLGTVWKLAVL